MTKESIVSSALQEAQYWTEDDGTIYGEIPGCPGVFATGNTIEDCRETLEEVLEGWIILGRRLSHPHTPM